MQMYFSVLADCDLLFEPCHRGIQFCRTAGDIDFQSDFRRTVFAADTGNQVIPARILTLSFQLRHGFDFKSGGESMENQLSVSAAEPAESPAPAGGARKINGGYSHAPDYCGQIHFLRIALHAPRSPEQTAGTVFRPDPFFMTDPVSPEAAGADRHLRAHSG